MTQKTFKVQRRTPDNRGKTPNAQRPTSNIEWRTRGVRVLELPNVAYADRQFDLENRLLEFAAAVVELTESLPNTRAGNHIASQLLRCGTSPLSNHGEVEAAESRRDFLHKLRVCLKELRETRRWLRLAGRLKRLAQAPNLAACLTEVDELVRIFAASVRTAEKNMR